MASKTEKYHVMVIFLQIFYQLFANSTSPMDYTLLQDLKKVYCMGGSLENRWPSNGGHELSLNKPQHDVPFWASHSMYIVMVHFIVGICDLSWPLMASKTEKYHVMVIFLQIFYQLFANSTSPMDYTLLQDLKKVYCKGISLEVRWPSNGGHELSLNKPLHDVPFWASHLMYIVMVQ